MMLTRSMLPRSDRRPMLMKISWMPFSTSASLAPSFLGVAGRFPSETNSCALSSTLVVLSSPRPIPMMTVLLPIRLTLRRYSMLDCECL